MPTESFATTPNDTFDVMRLLAVLTALKKGDFSSRMPEHHTGLAGKVADTLSDVIDREVRLGQEYDRVSLAVGKEGQISQRIKREDVPGGWGRTKYLLGISEDITERKHAEEEHRQLEEQFRASQKREAIDSLAGGVAHDFNNINDARLVCAQYAGEIHLLTTDVVMPGMRGSALVQELSKTRPKLKVLYIHVGLLRRYDRPPRFARRENTFPRQAFQHSRRGAKSPGRVGRRPHPQ